MNRNLVERERRSTMRNLFSRLFSLLPPQSTRMSIADMVERATIYINQFQRHLEELRQRRMQLEELANRATRQLSISPVVNIIDSNSNTFEANLITGSEMEFSLSEIIGIIEEGAEILNVTYTRAGNMNILSIHCVQVISRIRMFDRSRLHERLTVLIED